MRILVPFVLVAAVGCGGPRFTVPAEAPNPPAAVLAAVAERWPGAELSSAGCPGSTAAAKAFFVADVNGDGHPDSVVRVKTSDGVHLVAVFTRTHEYDVVDMARADAPATLALSVRGAKYARPDFIGDYFLSTDTLVLTPCGQAPVAYMWNGTAFQPVTLTGAPSR